MKVEEFKKSVLNSLDEIPELPYGSVFIEMHYDKADYQKTLDEILDQEEMSVKEIEETLKEAQNEPYRIADNLTDIYTADLLEWYMKDLDRISYLDEALKNLEAPDGITALSEGQFLYWEEVVSEVIEKGLETLKNFKKK
jgi:hypothetical protein